MNFSKEQSVRVCVCIYFTLARIIPGLHQATESLARRCNAVASPSIRAPPGPNSNANSNSKLELQLQWILNVFFLELQSLHSHSHARCPPQAHDPSELHSDPFHWAARSFARRSPASSLFAVAHKMRPRLRELKLNNYNIQSTLRRLARRDPRASIPPSRR